MFLLFRGYFLNVTLKTICVIAVFLVGALTVLPVFGQEPTTVTISKGAGSGQACVSAKNCFDPNMLSISPGTEVEWKNSDQVSHTVTSGNPSDNQTGTVFDSGLIAPGKTFTFTFKNAGTYNYFCQVHPWMMGEVVVGSSAATTSSAAPEFGQVTPVILIISIMAIVVLSQKFRVLR